MGQEDIGEAGRDWDGGASQPGVGLWPTAATQQGGGLGEGLAPRFGGVRAPPCRVDFPWGEGLCGPSLGPCRAGCLSPEIEGGRLIVNQEAVFVGGSVDRWCCRCQKDSFRALLPLL